MQLEINKIFKSLEIKPESTVVIHGDAIIAAQYPQKKSQKIDYLVENIINFFDDRGTLIVPTFNQSNFIEKKIFDVAKTPSKIGFFYEKFRVHKLANRTSHPFFSFVIFGKDKKKYLNTQIKDCFGKRTIFELLYKKNAKIVNLGCRWQCSFIHFVEQKIKVDYRYFKKFIGIIKDKNGYKKIKVNYFVRDLRKNLTYNLDKLEQKLKEKNKINYASFGRFQVSSVNAKDVYKFTLQNIKINKKFLLDD